MAMAIKKKYNLAGFKVSLITGTSDASIRLEFEVTEAHEPKTMSSWTFSASEFGLPSRFDPDKVLSQGYQFLLPQQVQLELHDAVRIPWDVSYGGPFWLHLVKPYGYLGLVPWEDLLFDLVERPILRLPDVWAEPPAEIPSTLDVALCASEPVADSPFDIVKSLTIITDHLLNVPRSRIRVDVLTDSRAAESFGAYWAKRGELNSRVFVHDPTLSNEFAIPRRNLQVEKVREIESPWLLWMRNALRGRSVDHVHFLGHGYLAGTKGAIAVAESPMMNRDPSWSRFVSSDELNLFLCQVGAWSVAIDSPVGNYSEMGLRAVADDLAQRRPGPTMHHETRLDDPELSGLREAFHFLFNPEPSLPRESRSIALCCQPFRVAGYEQKMRGVRPLIEDSILFRESRQGNIASEDNMPAWIAAAQRYVEQKQFELSQVRVVTSASKLTRTDAQVVGVERGLQDIRRAITLMAKKSGVKL